MSENKPWAGPLPLLVRRLWRFITKWLFWRWFGPVIELDAGEVNYFYEGVIIRCGGRTLEVVRVRENTITVREVDA